MAALYRDAATGIAQKEKAFLRYLLFKTLAVLLFQNQRGHECAVHVIGKGKERPFVFELEGGKFLEELFHDILVFLRFETAGAINQRPARLHERTGLAQQI